MFMRLSSNELRRANDLALHFGHGSSEAILKRLDGDLVSGQVRHFGQLR